MWALDALRVRQVSLITPYEPWLARRVERFLNEYGVTVSAGRHFGLALPRDIEAVKPEEVVRCAHELVEAQVAGQAIVVACTAMRGLEAAAAAAGVLPVPVVSSNQATIWGICERARWVMSAAWRGSLPRSRC